MVGFGPTDQAAPAPAPAAAPAADGAQPYQQPQPHPDAKEEYDTIVDLGLQILYDDGFMASAEEMMAGDKDPVDGMASIGGLIGTHVYTTALDQGFTPNPPVFIEAGVQLMYEIAEFVEALGYTVTGEDVEDAFLLASENTRNSLDGMGLIDEQIMEDAVQQAQAQLSPEEMRKGTERFEKAKSRVGANFQRSANKEGAV